VKVGGVGAWLRARVRPVARRGSGLSGSTGGNDEPVISTVPRPSFAYVAGWVLVMLLGLQAVTGAALAAFYSPSTTDAWASVAYLQDQISLGWLVRGLHFHGASALVIVTGLHLVQTAVWGAYKKPREVVWWLGIVLLLLVLAFAITGYVLRWDQAGYWANQVEIGIAAGTPVVGGAIKQLALGGNDYGNLTLTRFYALHVAVLPSIVTLLVVMHVVVARRHGATAHWAHDGAAAVARWPQQSFRNVIAMALVFAVLLGYTVQTSGIDLAAPADPTLAYDARPLWYFRWLFGLRHLAGSAEQIVAMAVPGLLVGFFIALPLIDKKPERKPTARLMFLGPLVGVLAIIAGLTVMSVMADRGDEALAKREHEDAMRSGRLRAIAAKYGVPATGPLHLKEQLPMYRARTLWATRCADCHDATSKERAGPIIGVGYGTRASIKAFLLKPSADEFWGRTDFGKTEDAMKPVELAQAGQEPDATHFTAAELDDVVEVLYAQSGARDADQTKSDRGKKLFGEKGCSDCHSLDEGVAGGSGPGLARTRSRDWYTSYIGNPKAEIHMGTKSEMPAFADELSIVDRDLLAEYLVWLRTATKADLDRLGPL